MPSLLSSFSRRKTNNRGGVKKTSASSSNVGGFPQTALPSTTWQPVRPNIEQQQQQQKRQRQQIHQQQQQQRLLDERNDLKQRNQELENVLSMVTSQLAQKSALVDRILAENNTKTATSDPNENQNLGGNSQFPFHAFNAFKLDLPNNTKDGTEISAVTEATSTFSTSVEDADGEELTLKLGRVWACLDKLQDQDKTRSESSQPQKQQQQQIQTLEKERDDLNRQLETLTEQRQAEHKKRKLEEKEIMKVMKFMQDRIHVLEEEESFPDVWLQTQLEELQQAHAKTKEQLETTQTQMKQLESKHTTLKQEHAVQKDAFEKLETEGLRLLDEFDQLDESNERLVTQLKSKDDAFLIMVQHETALKSKIRKLEREIEQLQKEQEEKSMTPDQQQTRIVSPTKSSPPVPSDQSLAKISRLEHKCQNLEHQCLSYTEKIQELQDELVEAQKPPSGLIQLQKRCDGQVSRIQQLERELATQKTKNKSHVISAERTQLELQNKTQAAKIHSLESSEQKWQEKYHKLQANMERQAQQMKLMTIEAIKELEASRLELEHTCEDQRIEIVRLKQQAAR